MAASPGRIGDCRATSDRVGLALGRDGDGAFEYRRTKPFYDRGSCLPPMGCKKEESPIKEHYPPPAQGGVKDSVSGHIRFHSVGLPSGYVEFFDESGHSATGTVMMGGIYTVWNPPRGRVKITVRSYAPTTVSKAPPPLQKPASSSRPVTRIPTHPV